MESSAFVEEVFTEKNSTKIFYLGNEDRVVKLSSGDISASIIDIAVSLYFENDITGDTMKRALQKASEEHYELFGRIIPHPTQCFQLKVDSEGWFPFAEQNCNLTVHEALAKYGQNEAFPGEDRETTRSKLVFSAHLDVKQLEKEKKPLFQCKLTHFVDGYCALGFVFSHLLVDGQRFVDLLVDIGKAARGLDIETKFHDRTLMWPDVFLKKIQVSGLDPADFPQTASPEFANLDVPSLTSQNETLFSLFLHFPEELLRQLKETLSEHLSQGEYLSTADVVLGVMWLVFCEADVAESDEKTLPERLKESIIYNSFDAHKNGASWVPSNYSANAVFSTPLTYQEIETDVKKDSLIEMLLNAALTIRRGILGLRGNQAKLAVCLSGRYHMINDVARLKQFSNSCNVMFSSSWTKMGFEDIDFGGGKPCFIDCLCETPQLPGLILLTPGLKNGGVFVSTYATRSQQNSLFKSRILKECAPDVNFVFGKDATNPEFNLQL